MHGLNVSTPMLSQVLSHRPDVLSANRTGIVSRVQPKTAEASPRDEVSLSPSDVALAASCGSKESAPNVEQAGECAGGLQDDAETEQHNTDHDAGQRQVVLDAGAA